MRKKFGEWQLCPKCQGQKLVWMPSGYPYNPTFVSTGPVPCDICAGAGIIQKPVIE